MGLRLWGKKAADRAEAGAELQCSHSEPAPPLRGPEAGMALHVVPNWGTGHAFRPRHLSVTRCPLALWNCSVTLCREFSVAWRLRGDRWEGTDVEPSVTSWETRAFVQKGWSAVVQCPLRLQALRTALTSFRLRCQIRADQWLCDETWKRPGRSSKLNRGHMTQQCHSWVRPGEMKHTSAQKCAHKHSE